MKLQFKKSLAVVAGLMTISFTAFAGAPCHLGDTCSIPSVTDAVYYSFDQTAGTSFVCEVHATDNKDLQVQISSDKEFSFPTQTLKADKNGEAASAAFSGHFNEGAKEGRIVVRQTLLTLNAEGSVKCYANN